MKTPIKAAFFCNGGPNDAKLARVFANGARLDAQIELLAPVVTNANFSHYAPQLRDLEVIFATWGLWNLSPVQLDALPALQAVFYAAGTVQHFAPALLEREVLVVSAWAANAVPVAETTLAQILLANKGFFRNWSEYRLRERGAFVGRGNYGATVSLLGAGQIGRRVIELLRPFQLKVLVFDPFLSDENAQLLNVEKVELNQAFARGDVVSNHLANLPATRGLIHGAHFTLLPQNATFLNSGRGATVNHLDLLEVFTQRSDLTALLDVTDPEPLPLSHPLRALPNVHLSSHIAGSIGDEVTRMGDLVMDEFERWQRGETPLYAVTRAMLETMA